MQTERINQLIAEELSKRLLGHVGVFRRAPLRNVQVEVWSTGEREDWKAYALFTDSRDSCALFEETLSDDEKLRYIGYATQIVGGYAGSVELRIKMIFLRPTQRCEAFLKTVGLWVSE